MPICRSRTRSVCPHGAPTRGSLLSAALQRERSGVPSRRRRGLIAPACSPSERNEHARTHTHRLHHAHPALRGALPIIKQECLAQFYCRPSHGSGGVYVCVCVCVWGGGVSAGGQTTGRVHTTVTVMQCTSASKQAIGPHAIICLQTRGDI